MRKRSRQGWDSGIFNGLLRKTEMGILVMVMVMVMMMVVAGMNDNHNLRLRRVGHCEAEDEYES